MSTNIANKSPYLRTSREFPEDPPSLSIELSKAYIDIANNVNSRSIGNFSTVPTVTGDTWYVSGGNTKQQTLRQVYTISSTGSIPHGIPVNNISGFVSIYATFTNGTNWYALPYVDITDVTNQISLEVTATDIVITAGSGTPPTILKGFVILEWLSQI